MSENTITFDDITLTCWSDQGKKMALEYAGRIKNCSGHDHPAQLRHWAKELIAFIDKEFDL